MLVKARVENCSGLVGLSHHMWVVGVLEPKVTSRWCTLKAKMVCSLVGTIIHLCYSEDRSGRSSATSSLGASKGEFSFTFVQIVDDFCKIFDFQL